jgi:RNA polymerase sigma-70 factor, ECF subfamily
MPSRNSVKPGSPGRPQDPGSPGRSAAAAENPADLAGRRRPPELDELTLARAQRGDDAACRALVVRYQGPVFAMLGRMLGGSGPVEDLAQETFLRVFRALPGFRPAGPARLSSWILTIATRLALDELRRRRPRLTGERDDRIDELPAIELGVADRRALGIAIEAAIAALPVEHRATFLLRELHGLEYRAIADTLQIDIDSVKSRLFRARAALQRALAPLRGGR